MKKQIDTQYSSNFPPLHWRNLAKSLTVTQAIACISFVYNALTRRYTV